METLHEGQVPELLVETFGDSLADSGATGAGTSETSKTEIARVAEQSKIVLQ
jgi:hypothetical protein